MTQSEPVDRVFRRLDRKAAEAHYQQYVDTANDRLAAFKSLVERLSGPVLDDSEESFARLGAWLLDALQEGDRDAASTPVWAFAGDDFPGRLSSTSLQLIDGTALYLAEVLRKRHPHLAWEMARNPKIVDHHQPVLTGFGLTRLPPLMPVMRVFSARRPDARDPEWLVKLLRVWDENARKARPQDGSDIEAIDDVDVVALDDDPDWDVEITIPDSAEHVLGRQRFLELPERLERLPGIVRLAWEDRERFLAKLAPETRHETVRDAVAAALRDAAKVDSARPSR
jgi:hypothetical protein